MKRLCLFLMLGMISVGSLYARSITLNIPDTDIAIVENDVIDAEQWIKDAWAGKLNKCKERMIKQAVDTSIKKGEVIPAGEAAIVDKYLKSPDYKSRRQREEESKLK